MFGIKNPQNPEAEMGFFDHVEALRWHIIRSFIAILVCTSVVGYFYEFVFNTIILGVQSRNFPTYRFMCWMAAKFPYLKDICVDHDLNIHLQNTAMFGQINLLFQYCIILGIVIAFPYIIWELWRFVAPALQEDQVKKTSRIIFACSGFFFTGILFSYFVIIPFSINFAVSFTVSSTIRNDFTIDNYIDFFTAMLLAIGTVFELPMIVYFLAKFGIIGPAIMRRSRRYAILVVAIIAGMITPSPDVFSQCLVGLPIYVLYELSIFIAARVEKDNIKKNTASA